MAGLHKHKWSYLVKYMPDHFGSNKWHPPNPSVTRRWVNVGELDRVTAVGAPDPSTGVLDLGKLGYEKLLGQGSLSKPLKLKVARASSSAVEKVKAAGGNVEVEFAAAEVEREKQKEGSEKAKADKSASRGSSASSSGSKGGKEQD